ncbi:hypothetical protein CI102_13958 [Trichoderma harzianum]|nr:hypothetical protein CI102_13958 [Trichoderma harzianum]
MFCLRDRSLFSSSAIFFSVRSWGWNSTYNPIPSCWSPLFISSYPAPLSMILTSFGFAEWRRPTHLNQRLLKHVFKVRDTIQRLNEVIVSKLPPEFSTNDFHLFGTWIIICSQHCAIPSNIGSN